MLRVIGKKKVTVHLGEVIALHRLQLVAHQVHLTQAEYFVLLLLQEVEEMIFAHQVKEVVATACHHEQQLEMMASASAVHQVLAKEKEEREILQQELMAIEPLFQVPSFVEMGMESLVRHQGGCMPPKKE